jgi:ATP synthase F1 delta subunit
MTAEGGLGAMARDAIRDLAERAGLDDLKRVLAQIEQHGDEGERPDAEVWSAVDLTPDERRQLEGTLRAAHGQDLEISYHVDAALLGGLIVRVGDRYVDGSLATKLGRLRQELVGTGA